MTWRKTVCRGWPWAWPVVKSHKCLWILVRLGVSWDGFVGPVDSADCGACSWLLIVDAAIQIDLLSPKRFLGISFIDQKIRKEIRVFPWKLVWDLVANAAAAAAKLLQLCPNFCDPMDCSPSGSSVHRILQARILKWVAMPSSRGSSWPRDWNSVSYVSFIGTQVLYH